MIVKPSNEIVGEKKEENVGSKCTLEKSDVTGMALFCLDYSLLKGAIDGFNPGESRLVKSINFDTPNGVPDVVFVETPLEKLRRAMKESSGIANDHRNSLDAWSHLYAACMEFSEGKGV